MAVTHLFFNQTSQYGNQLRSALSQLEQGRDQLNDVLTAMATMINGDGSSSTHFPYMTAKFGFTDDTTARAAWLEITALLAKLNTDASVTNLNTALNQAFNEFR